ncbi:hypothetical protein Csac_1962 [Caldicellulosiruptor saccharolyticus DSM 8903]|uniref:Uncharacterized protein n=1 Tax=Caldicellulosiruptor saccharolyticus (strain ATCC 43494 / DSM 8903 / Tp8T 6331) TaxID=351627 RepID=A4XKW2_CALS8|nr:hypothetical protein [Caldicellulosiruptor saccharolyticus]ABP67547.1 hypothetical protein Csac_1962 [Caldicellulosiruptor saccharolyticus DSM 8903]
MIFPTSFFGYSKVEVRAYIEKLNEDFKSQSYKLESQKELLIKENERLKNEIERLSLQLSTIHIKDISCYQRFIDDYFFNEWKEYYSKKASEVETEYSKSLEELEKIKEDILNHILYIKKQKEKTIKKLKETVDEIESLLNNEEELSLRKLQRDFYIDGNLILPSGIIINHEVIENMKERGFLIEFLKHLAKEDEDI